MGFILEKLIRGRKAFKVVWVECIFRERILFLRDSQRNEGANVPKRGKR